MVNIQKGQCIILCIDEDLMYCEIVQYGPYECLVSLSRNPYVDSSVKRFPAVQRLSTEAIIENMIKIEDLD